MKILQLATVLWPSGVTRALLEQTMALRRLGHDARILSMLPNPFGLLPKDFLREAVPIYYQSDTKLSHPLLKGATDFLRAKISPQTPPSDFIPDAIISHNFANAYFGLRMARATGAKFALFLYDPGGLLFHTSPFRWAHRIRIKGVGGKAFLYIDTDAAVHNSTLRKEKELISHVDVLFAQTRAVAEQGEKLYQRKAIPIHWGTMPVSSPPDSRGDFVLLGCTSLDVEREFDKAFSACAQAKAKLKIAGRQSYTTQKLLEQLALSGADAEVVISTPEKNYGNSWDKLYEECRLFFNWHPETFGLPIIEAASHGAPIVASRLSGAAELFSDNLDGHFPPVPDHDAFVEAIRDLMADEHKAHRMGEHAWRTCKSWTWENHASKVIQHLR